MGRLNISKAWARGDRVKFIYKVEGTKTTEQLKQFFNLTLKRKKVKKSYIFFNGCFDAEFLYVNVCSI